MSPRCCGGAGITSRCTGRTRSQCLATSRSITENGPICDASPVSYWCPVWPSPPAMLERLLAEEFTLTFPDGRLYTREHDPLAPRQRPRARRPGVRPRVDHIARLLLDAAF